MQGSSVAVRRPAVADRFYVGRADRLTASIERYVGNARAGLAQAPRHPGRLRALISPHAGYIYSGATAGFAYAVVDPAAVKRVLLLGPAHYVPVPGMALSSAFAWRTPLGEVRLDQEAGNALRSSFDSVFFHDAAHAPEHSLEVQLPFLQTVLPGGFELVPLLVGTDLVGEVGAVIDMLSADPATLVVVSSDLSHYLDYDTARAKDAKTLQAIESCDAAAIQSDDACGRYPLRGLLHYAKGRRWAADVLDARNSGDTAGDRARVVGYAAVAFWAQPPAGEPLTEPRAAVGNLTGTGQQAGGAPAGSHEQSNSLAASSRPAGPTESPGPAPSSAPGGPATVRPASVTGSGSSREPSSRSAPAAQVILSPAARTRLLQLARAVIEKSLGQAASGDAGDWHAAAASFPELAAPGAAFVTLRSAGGDLLGCIGSLSPHQSLAADVAEHAYDAAFRDPRFAPLTATGARDAVLDIAVLGPRVPFSVDGYDELVATFPRGRGIVVNAGRHRATFLPSVWEQLPEPAEFVAALWRKAGLARGEWPRATHIELYEVLEFAE